ncbi:MAG: hypothetical protein ACLUB2_01035 [Butyricicoccus pullicaecorum]
MYRLYRFFAERGQGTRFIHTLSVLPQSILERIGLILVPSAHH